MTQRDDVLYERFLIRVLQNERLFIQKKTFTKWINAVLLPSQLKVENLFTDLRNGEILFKLLEIISGEKLGKLSKGKMRIHCLENVSTSLNFLRTQVMLESIGAVDIVDGNPRLILGLIWSILIRFQIQDIEIDMDEEDESSEKKSAKDALLLWCQRKTKGYSNVHIKDFTVSWRSGMAFNAIIHAHRPDLFEFNDLQPTKHIDNLNHAFDVANNKLGIAKLLDAEDIDTSSPDEKSIIIYVSSYYHTFTGMKNKMKSDCKITNINGQMEEVDKMKMNHERLTTKFLEWIRTKVIELKDRQFPNSLEGIQSLLLAFENYRTQEKPPKYKERSEIEAMNLQINTQLKSLNQIKYIPPDGQLIQDIERAWEGLEKAEHERELSLQRELKRQERLEQLNHKFEKKLAFESAEVDPHLMAVEDLSAQLLDIEELQVNALGETIKQDETIPSEERRASLEAKNFFKFLQDQKVEKAWLIEKQRLCQAGISVKDLRVILSLQQKHKALEEEMEARKHKCDQLCLTGKTLVKEKHLRSSEIEQHIESIEEHWSGLLDLAARRRNQLEDAVEIYQFRADANEADYWMNEKLALVNSSDYGVDEPNAQALLQIHKDLEGKVDAYSGDIQGLNLQANRLIEKGISSLELEAEPEAMTDVEEEEWISEPRLVPTEVWEDEPIEKEEYKMVEEERSIPQVKVLYPFNGQGMFIVKGEIMFLINKSTPEWWSIRKADGTDGFVPANYVHEIEPRIIKIRVRRPEKIETVQQVKKTKMVKQMVQVRHRTVKKPKGTANDKQGDAIAKRQNKINNGYMELKKLASRRHDLLDDSIKLFGFYRECDDFERWIKDIEKLLIPDDSSDNVETARKYEKFLTDLSASTKRIEALDITVDGFINQGYSQFDKVRNRQRHINKLWDNLNRLKAMKENNLEELQ